MNTIRKEFHSIGDIVEASDVNIAYSDEDILVIDSAKEMEEMLPIRLGMNVICLCLRGRVQIDVNGEGMMLNERGLLMLPSNTIIEHPMTSPDYDCRFLCLTNRIVNDFLRQYINVWNQTMYVNRMKIRSMSEGDVHNISMFYELLKNNVMATTHTKYKKEIIRSLLKAAILGLCASLEDAMENETPSDVTHANGLFRKFLDMLNRDGEKRHSVRYYAEGLCVTPKYLSVLCMKNSGKTAKQWINECMVENARYYLKSTDLSIKEISDMLGFPSTSYFGRYVKKNFGAPPVAFRSGSMKGEEL